MSPWNDTGSVTGRSQPTSSAVCDKLNIIWQVLRSLPRQRLVHQTSEFEGFSGASEASATRVGPAWCGRIGWPQTRAGQQRSGLTVLSAADCRPSKTSASCNSPGDRKWTPGLKSWQRHSTVTKQLGGVARGSSSQIDTEPWRVLRVIVVKK